MNREKRSEISPLTVRLTTEERASVEADAGERSMSAHIRACLLEKHQLSRRRKVKRPPSIDQETAARLLAELKRTHYASNLNQLTKAVNSGLLALPEEECSLLRSACEHIAEMRALLLNSLGL